MATEAAERFARRVQRIVESRPRGSTHRATALAAVEGHDHRRHSEAIDESRGDDAHHADVPSLGRDHDGGRLGLPGLGDLHQCFGGDFSLNLATQAALLLDLGGEGACAVEVGFE